MTIKEAYERLKKEIPSAEFISVGTDLNWWPHRGDAVEVEYTVAVTVQGYRHQQSCVHSLEGAVLTILGEVNGPSDAEVAAMVGIHGEGIAELSNDNG